MLLPFPDSCQEVGTLDVCVDVAAGVEVLESLQLSREADD